MQRSPKDRLYDHLADTVLPRVASVLGPGWVGKRMTLTAPGGESFLFQLSWPLLGPRLLVSPRVDCVETGGELPPSVSITATATPETIVEILQTDLFPTCAPRVGSAASS